MVSPGAGFRCTRCTRRSTQITSGAAPVRPPVNLASTDRAGLVEAMDEVKRALEIAEQIPFRFLDTAFGSAKRNLQREEVRVSNDFY